jgi:hypothetical protein
MSTSIHSFSRAHEFMNSEAGPFFVGPSHWWDLKIFSVLFSVSFGSELSMCRANACDELRDF